MWQIFIDTSGMPPNEDVYIGLVLFDDRIKGQFINSFYRQFPFLKSYQRKSSRVDHGLHP